MNQDFAKLSLHFSTLAQREAALVQEGAEKDRIIAALELMQVALTPSQQTLLKEHAAKVKGDVLQVHKDECAYTFASPFSPGGLYLDLSTLQVC